jgi:hypothetical protein
MLSAATTRFSAADLRARCYPVLGDHDLLVQGVLAPTPLTGAIARGDRAVWQPPPRLTAPARAIGVAAAAPGGVRGLGDVSRELAYLDAKGPQGSAGGRLDRNVTLCKRAR